MRRGKGKLLAVAGGLISVAAVVALAMALSGSVLEMWHLRQLSSPNNANVEAAIKYLHKVRSNDAAPALGIIVRSGQSPVCERAAVALWDVGPIGRHELNGALEAVEWSSRQRILDRLSQHGGKPRELFPFVETALLSSVESPAAAVWLGDRPRYVPALRASLSDRKKPLAIRRGAATALGHLGGRLVACDPRDSTGALDDLRQVSRSSAEALPLRLAAFRALDALGGSSINSRRGTLRVSAKPVRPGETVELAFRATFQRPLKNFLMEFQIEGLNTEFAGSVATGTATERFPSSAVASGRVPKGGFLTGVVLTRSDAEVVVEPGNNVLLVKAAVKIPADATPGNYPIKMKDATLTTLGSKSLKLDVVKTEVLRVEPGRGTAPATATPETAVVSDREEPSLIVEETAEGMRLKWQPGSRVGEPDDPLVLIRNNERIATLNGEPSEYLDRFDSKLLTEYRLESAAGKVVAKTRINEFIAPFHFRAEIAHAQPGQKAVQIRVYGTHHREVSGLSFGLRIPPESVRIQEISSNDTTTEAAGLGSFMYQKHSLDLGETALGALDMSPPLVRMPAGTDEHIATILVEVADDATSGTVIPVEFGPFGKPKGSVIYAVDGARGKSGSQSEEATVCHGAILIGKSPVSVVSNPAAAPSYNERDGRVIVRGVRLSWKNTAPYLRLEIERDGEPIAKILGNSETFLDTAVGPGKHYYRVRAIATKDGQELRSFPVEFPITLFPVREPKP